jgi:hypothetical protein
LRRKPANWQKFASIAIAAREAACKLAAGQKLTPVERKRLPGYVRHALVHLKPKRSRYLSSRLDESPKPYDPRRWLIRLGMARAPITTVKLQDYDACVAVGPELFTDALLEAAVREFESFPGPAPLLKFLRDWRKKHPPSTRPSQKRWHQRSLWLTDTERKHLVEAAETAYRNGTVVPNGPVKRLTGVHVRIAQHLAGWEPEQSKQPTGRNRKRERPSHEKLAQAASTSVRTVRRALPALRALGALYDEWRGLSTIEKPAHVVGFQQKVMALIAEHAGVPVKTLYRWEGDLRETVGKSRKIERRSSGKRAHRLRSD